MPIYVSLAATWPALYNDDELEQVREALVQDDARNEAEWGSSIPYDWQGYSAGRMNDVPPSWFHVPYDESQDFTAALSYLCDHNASTAARLEFIPGYLSAPLELAAPDTPGRSWRIYSGEIMAVRWLTNEKDHDEFQRLARLYRWSHGWSDQGEVEQLTAEYGTDIPVGDRLDARRQARAYYIERLGELADVGRRASVPGFVTW